MNTLPPDLSEVIGAVEATDAMESALSCRQHGTINRWSNLAAAAPVIVDVICKVRVVRLDGAALGELVTELRVPLEKAERSRIPVLYM